MSVTVDWNAMELGFKPDPEDEPVYCRSQLFVTDDRGRPAGSVTCALTVEHTGAGLDDRHGLGLTRWTSADADDSLAVYLASQGPRCTECPRPALESGVCGYHRGRELADDDIETESEAAA